MKSPFLLAAIAAISLAAPVSAQTAAPETVSRGVRVADLNLSDPAHVARLDDRIGRAARALCRVSSSYDVATRMRVRECIARAKSDAAARRDIAVAAARAVPVTRTASR